MKMMKELLLGKRDEILNLLNVARKNCLETKPRHTIKTHPADYEELPEIFSFNMARIRNLEDYLKKVEKAIEKLDNGNYGYCEGCGKKIPFKRLKIVPFADLCIHCQKEVEKAQKIKTFLRWR